MPDEARQPSHQTASLYEEDHLAWIEAQTAHLRAGRTDALDLTNLAEELEGMAASQRKELRSRLRALLTHLLEIRHQPKRRTRSWDATIVAQRQEVADLLELSPSLRREVDATMRRVYAGTVKRAAAETGLPPSAFPEELQFTTAEVLGDEDV